MAITPDDIAAMFKGIDRPTIGLILGTLRSQFTATIAAINATGISRAALSPPPHLILNAFRLTPISRIRVVLIGQDPYINPGQAMGLSFSTPAGVRIPPSLLAIFKCLQHSGFIEKIPDNGDLTDWAAQGVLLINSALTTQMGTSDAHGKIWKDYTDALMDKLQSHPRRLIFILLGKNAQSTPVNTNLHDVLSWGHPSPQVDHNRKPENPKNFIYCDVFARTNELLESRGEEPIRWGAKPLCRPAAEAARIDVPVQAADDPPCTNAMRELIDDDTLWIFTDGGAVANGKASCRASWAFYAVSREVSVVQSGRVVSGDGLPKPSNNRGEMTAMMRALDFIAGSGARKSVIVSDSELCIKTLTLWAAKWIADPAKGEKRKNMDLVVPAYNRLQEIRAGGQIVDFTHVNSHKTEPPVKGSTAWFQWCGNSTADSACTAALLQ